MRTAVLAYDVPMPSWLTLSEGPEPDAADAVAATVDATVLGTIDALWCRRRMRLAAEYLFDVAVDMTVPVETAIDNVTTVFGAMMQNPTGVRGWPSDA